MPPLGLFISALLHFPSSLIQYHREQFSWDHYLQGEHLLCLPFWYPLPTAFTYRIPLYMGTYLMWFR